MAAPSYPSLGFGKLKFTRKALGAALRHTIKQKITELLPNKKAVWHVLDSSLNFLKDKSEWTGTDILFDVLAKDGKTEVRFTHVGLAPQIECYGSCSNAWSMLVNGNLRKLITTGKTQPDVCA